MNNVIRADFGNCFMSRSKTISAIEKILD